MFLDPHMRTPYTYQYNLNVQHQISNGLAAELGYVGSSSHKFTANVDFDPFIDGGVNDSRLQNHAKRIPRSYAGQLHHYGGNDQCDQWKL